MRNDWVNKFELQRSNRKNLLPMEGIRGFSILIVFVGHYIIHSLPYLPDNSLTKSISKTFFDNAHTAVDLFFLLSGFFIYGALISRPRSTKQFYLRRAERIYPPFIIVFLLYILLSYFFPSENKIPAGFFEGAKYIFANLLFLPGFFPIQPMISVTWTMSYEIFFYITIPLIIAIFQLRKWPIRWRYIFHFGLAIATLFIFSQWGGHIRMVMFVSGMLLHDVLSSNKDIKFLPGLGLISLMISFSLMSFIDATPAGLRLRVGLLFVLLFLTSLDCITNPNGACAKFFSWTPIRWLGNMSYSYYLIHGVVLKGVFLLIIILWNPNTISPIFFWLGLLPAFGLTLIVAIPLYLFIEYPYSMVPKRFREKALARE